MRPQSLRELWLATVFLIGGSVVLVQPVIISTTPANAQEATGGNNYSPLWSPSGERILFLSRRMAKTEIYVMNSDGSGQRQLTTTAVGDSTSHAWSPDGQRIAYSSGVGINTQIYVMNADGSGQRRLTERGKNTDPAWSPDGRRIAFRSGDNLHAMNADGTSMTPITSDQNLSRSSASFSWAPDGARLVLGTYKYDPGIYVYQQPGGPTVIIVTSGRSVQSIDLINADGRGRRALSAAPGDEDPAWSPDGRRIVFVSGRDESTQIYLMNPDGSGTTRLTSEGRNRSPVWSRDSQRIAFVSSKDGKNEIYVANADGSAQTRLTHSRDNSAPSAQSFLFGQSAASWSPDGRRIVFSSSRGAFSHIYVINVDGTGETQLTRDPP